MIQSDTYKTFVILTQYFPPEIGAPQYRLYELAKSLKNNKFRVIVLTALPNYPKNEIYEGYRCEKYRFDIMDDIEVHRFTLYIPKKRTPFKRLFQYISFAYNVIKYSKRVLTEEIDYLFWETPPIFLGWAAYVLKKRTGAKLITNVSDLWPESIEKLGIIKNKIILKPLYWFESFLYKKSVLVTGQTKGIISNISNRFPKVKTYWLPNGISADLFEYSYTKPTIWRKNHNFDENDFLIVYAGIIGYAQGLEIVIEAAKKLNNYPIHFLIFGEGPELYKLESRINEVTNVHLMGTITRKEIPTIIRAEDVALIPLRNIDLLQGAIPSKFLNILLLLNPDFRNKGKLMNFL